MIIESNIGLNFESSMINGKILFCMYVNAIANQHCYTANHLYLTSIFMCRYWQQKQKLPNYDTMKHSVEFSYTINNKWTHTLSMLVAGS